MLTCDKFGAHATNHLRIYVQYIHTNRSPKQSTGDYNT